VNTFTLLLQDAFRSERIDDVRSFVGEDASGSFDILPNHGRMMTILLVGLARFHVDKADWQYLALPGAVLYFCDNMLTLSTRRYLRDNDYTRISALLQQQLLAEEEQLQATRQSLRHLEESLLKRLWELTHRGG
jgi:F-type H+-transporting ATPase subunit epsilon